MDRVDLRKGPPPVPADLVEWLDWLYPEKCPEPNTPDREIWLYAGKRSIVRMLKDQLGAQAARASKSTPTSATA